jgi:hypothetical protein
MGLLDQVIRDITSVFTGTTQNCPTFVKNIQDFEVINEDGSVIYSHVTWKQVATVHVACVQAAVVTQHAENEIKAEEKRFIAAVMKAHPHVDSSDVAKLTTEISTSMTTDFTQNCAVDVINKQQFIIRNHKGDVIYHNVRWDQTIDAINSCVQTNITKNTAYTELGILIGELSPPPAPPSHITIKEVLTKWAWVVVPIVVGFFLKVGLGWKVHGKFLALVCGVALLTLGAGKFWGSWPYSDSSEKDATQNNNVLMGVFFGLGTVLTVIVVVIHHKDKPLHKKLGIEKGSEKRAQMPPISSQRFL